MIKKRTIGFYLLFVFFVAIVGASSFEDNSEGDFNAGTYTNTFYNASASGVEINISDGFSSGSYTSAIFDAGGVSEWHNISWISELCYGCELPDSASVETGSFMSFADMSNNVLLMHLNEASGTLSDDSGNNNDGTDVGGITYSANGQFNTAIDFDGSNDRIRIIDDNTLDITGDITLELWSYAHSFSGDPDVLTKGAFNQAYSIWYWSDGAVAFALDNDRLDSNTQLSTNTWYHIVAVREGSDRRIYINGVSDANDSYGSSISTNSANLFISTNSFPFDGVIDEVAIYDGALSAAEVRNHYLRGALALNLSVRSCDDSVCSGESFTPVTGSAPQDLSVDNNTYFQYEFDFATDDSDFTTTVFNVSVEYSSQVTFPEVSIVEPQNDSYNVVQSVLNYTVQSAVDCWYSLDGGATNTSTTCGDEITGLDSGQGSSTWAVYANNSLGDENVSSVTFFVDSVSPGVTIQTPANNSLLSTTDVTIAYNVSDDGSGVDSCWYSLDGGATNTSSVCEQNISIIASEGSNHVIVYVNDSLSNEGESSADFSVDTLDPSVSISTPSFGQTIGYNESIELNYTTTDSGSGINSCWYSLDGGATNTTVVGCANTTFDVVGDGDYVVVVYAEDAANNVASDSSNFSVQIGAPTIVLHAPLGSYLNYTENITFNYTATDPDLSLCELWGDFNGTFEEIKNDTSMVSGNESSFFVNLTDGNYLWGIYCEDRKGDNAFSNNQTVGIDTLVPTMSISEPAGTYASLTNIPLSFSVTDNSPVTCMYNVTFAGSGSEAVSNTVLPDCSSTTIGVDSESNYVLHFFTNDSVGFVNYTNTNFSVILDSGGGSSGGGGGGGSSGGGGGGGLSGLVGFAQLTLPELESLDVSRGQSEIISFDVLNSGSRFLNKCVLEPQGDVAEWISNKQVESLSSGQIIAYVFNVNVPVDASPGTHEVDLSISCNETSASTPFSVNVITNDFEIVILNSERVGSELEVTYSVENLAVRDQEVTINYAFSNAQDVILFESVEGPLFIAANSREEFTFRFPLPKDSVGSFSLLFDATNGKDAATLTQNVVLTTQGIAGFAISGENLRTLSWVGGVVFVLLAFYISLKFLYRHNKRVRVHETRKRHFIKINLNERKKRKK